MTKWWWWCWFQGVCETKQISKKVYEVASGNHEMYIRRRRPDTLEVNLQNPGERIMFDVSGSADEVPEEGRGGVESKGEGRSCEGIRCQVKSTFSLTFTFSQKAWFQTNYETFAGQRPSSFARRWRLSLLRWRRGWSRGKGSWRRLRLILGEKFKAASVWYWFQDNHEVAVYWWCHQ